MTYKIDFPQSCCSVNLLDLMRDDVADLQRLPLFRDSHISINALSLTVKVHWIRPLKRFPVGVILATTPVLLILQRRGSTLTTV